MALLCCGWSGVAAAESPPAVAVVLASESCPDSALEGALQRELLAVGEPLMPHHQVSAAFARLRAHTALRQARRLYTRTNFAGCISLLSLSELELSRSLADADPSRQQEAHELLARLTLWLGICQWAAGEPQAAGASFVRSAQLPGAPGPDPSLLPPELVVAYRGAVARPREHVTCAVDAPIKASHVLVDGKGPTVSRDGIVMAAGTHYVVIDAACAAEDPTCAALAAQVGPGGRRSVRLSTIGSCRIRLPAVQPAARITCMSRSEARDAQLVAALTSAAGASKTLVTEITRGRIVLRLHRRGGTAFQHQLVSNLGAGEEAPEAAGRSAKLLLATPAADLRHRARPPGEASARPWYGRWWVWAIAGTAAAGIIATAVVAARDDRTRVVFGP